MIEIDMGNYIATLPHWHKHQQGHIVKISEFRDNTFYGEFWNYASGHKIESSATFDQHKRYIETGELKELDPSDLAKHLLQEKE